jgi:translation elongation factor EF-G
MSLIELKRPIETEENKFLVIAVKYDLGGYNHFASKTDARGYKLYFSIKTIEDGWHKFTPTDGKNFKITIKEVKRQSKKTEEKIVDFIEEHKEELFEAFKEQDKNKCFEIIKSFK